MSTVEDPRTEPQDSEQETHDEALTENVLPILSISVARPSLDDVFMSYTGTTIRDAEASSTDRNRAMVRMMRR